MSNDTVNVREAFKARSRSRLTQQPSTRRPSSEPAPKEPRPLDNVGDMADTLTGIQPGAATTDSSNDVADETASTSDDSADSTSTEKWKLVGPAIRELPSPSYLAQIEKANPGFYSDVLDTVKADFMRVRTVHDHVNASKRRENSVRLIACVGYSVAALVAAIAMFLLNKTIPGYFLTVTSILALGLSVLETLPSAAKAPSVSLPSVKKKKEESKPAKDEDKKS